MTSTLVSLSPTHMEQLIPDVLGVVLGFVNGIKPLMRLAGCSRQFKCSVKEVVNLKVLAATREGFKLKEGETWIEVLRFIELRDSHIRSMQNQLVNSKVLAATREGFILKQGKTWLPQALTGMRVVSVSTGPFHTAAVTANGELYTLGWGSRGQLGHGTQTSELAPMRVEGALAEEWVVSVSAGSLHTVVLTASGVVFTFGDGGSGKLGHGTFDRQLTPKRVEALASHRVVCIAAGSSHTVVLTASGAVFTFGYNQSGQLGRATDQVPLNLPGEVELALLARECVVGLVLRYSGTGLEMSSGRLVTFGNM
jgi:hypothetical protein